MNKKNYSYKKQLSTGWFGVPGTQRSTNVHVLDNETKKCLCGYSPNKNYQFQWCAWGIEKDYLECEGCKTISKKLLNKEIL